MFINLFLLLSGNADLVVCFKCEVGLMAWTKYRNPVIEHLRFAAECSFAQECETLRKGLCDEEAKVREKERSAQSSHTGKRSSSVNRRDDPVCLYYQRGYRLHFYSS